jgi:hypothetical protein
VIVAELRDQLQISLGSAYAVERELGGGGLSRVFIAEAFALLRDTTAMYPALEQCIAGPSGWPRWWRGRLRPCDAQALPAIRAVCWAAAL